MPTRTTKALLSTIGVAAAALALPALLRRRGASRADDDAYYRALKTPAWAPPAWAFPAAWTLNTLALAWASQRLARDPAHPRRSELLVLLVLHWALYGTFGRVYFDARSPVLAAAWTGADFLVCHLGFYRALPVARPTALAFVPVNLWLTLALPLSAYQALANHDALFGAAGLEVGELLAGALGTTPPASR